MTRGPIASAHGSYNRIRQKAPMCTTIQKIAHPCRAHTNLSRNGTWIGSADYAGLTCAPNIHRQTGPHTHTHGQRNERHVYKQAASTRCMRCGLKHASQQSHLLTYDGRYRERKCADTTGTVLVACRFQCQNINIFFSNKIYGSNFIKQHSETAMV